MTLDMRHPLSSMTQCSLIEIEFVLLLQARNDLKYLQGVLDIFTSKIYSLKLLSVSDHFHFLNKLIFRSISAEPYVPQQHLKQAKKSFALRLVYFLNFLSGFRNNVT